MKVSQSMRRDVVTIDENCSVMEASRRMREKNEGCAIILRKGKPVGIVTERDVTWKVAGEGLDPRKVKVKDVMSSPLVTVSPDATLIEASELMSKHKIRRLAVVSDHKLHGILTAADIAINLEGYVDDEVRKILRATFFPIPH